MTFIPTPNVVRCAVQGKVNSNDQVVTLWFLGASPATPTDCQLLGDAVVVWSTTEILTILSNGYTAESVNAIAQDSITAPSTISVGTWPLVGAVNSPVIEPQTAPVVKFATSARGRSGRGRNYVPGCPLSSLSAPGVVGGSFKTALLNAYGAIGTYLASSTYNHVVVQHFSNNAPLSAGVPRFVAQYSMVSDSVGTQRRRRIGVGS